MSSSDIDFDSLNQRLEKMNPAEILWWTLFDQFHDKRVVATSSFQSQSLLLLFLIGKICPSLSVFFLDTGYHFRETHEYVRLLQVKLGLSVVSILPDASTFDDGMYETDPDMCCYLRKVEPLKKAFSDVDVWISGIRRDQTENRRSIKILELHSPLNVIKISPMANLTSAIHKEANMRLDLPEHPLKAIGYSSIGCTHCTSLPKDLGERSGRWAGSLKTECGLHLNQPKP